MNEIDTKYFKDKLLKEKTELERGLSEIGRINPDNPADWEATPGDMNEKTSDKNDSADGIEEFELRTATLKELEDELKEVNDALLRIEKGTYGLSEISGEPIEKARLEAYPAARTTAKEIQN